MFDAIKDINQQLNSLQQNLKRIDSQLQSVTKLGLQQSRMTLQIDQKLSKQLQSIEQTQRNTQLQFQKISSVSKSLEATIARPLEQARQQNQKLISQMEGRIKVSTAEILKPYATAVQASSLLNQQQAVALNQAKTEYQRHFQQVSAKAVKSLEATIARPLEQARQQNQKLISQMEGRIKVSTAEILKPYATAVRASSLLNQQHIYIQDYIQQISTAQISKPSYSTKGSQEFTKAYMAASVVMSQMEEQLTEHEHLEQEKQQELESAKISKVKKNIPKFSLSIETMYCFFPEDWRSNVEVRIQRQKKKDRPDYLVWILVIRCFMELFWAAVEVRWDNLWLLNDREIE